MDNSELIKRVQERQTKLHEAGVALKAHFVGLDDIIDKILVNIETWYTMPELLTRPVIVCLFGPTGVGKTDLVRRLIKQLDFTDRYAEIELANKNGNWARTVGGVLRESNRIESGKPAAILLDEIQNFRTIDEEGSEIADYEMKDVWGLLSDGKLPYKVEVESLLSMLWDYSKKEAEANAPKSAKKSHRPKSRKTRKVKFATPSFMIDDEKEESNYYQLTYFKSTLRLEEPIEEIALWTEAKKKAAIIKRLTDKSIYEEEDYSKCLIFISGNIDEAYGFTKNASEADIDADILYEKSKKITILDIKEALGKRFRPEQISRMGNTHIVYPSLSKTAFDTIIQRKIDSITDRVKTQTGINLIVETSINRIIYDNGVFPTQGTRPVFSTISEVLEASLPDFLKATMIKNEEKLSIYYDDSFSAIVGRVDGTIFKKPFVGNLDVIRANKKKNKDRKALVAVHEAAHAVTHAVLFGLSPNQIVANPVSEDMEGFVYSQDICYSKEMVNKRISVLLAGQQAEKMIFGEGKQTSGCSDDLRKATGFAASMIRRWGMEGWSSQIHTVDKNDLAFNGYLRTDDAIEAIVKERKDYTKNLLGQYSKLLLAVAERLIANDKISPENFKEICAEHGVTISVNPLSDDMVYSNYFDELMKFKENVVNPQTK